MYAKLSNFESQLNRLLEANVPLVNIIKYFNKSPRAIYNAKYRIKKKKISYFNKERASRGRVSKVSSRALRAINRDIIRSPKKQKKHLIRENSLDIPSRTLQRVLKD